MAAQMSRITCAGLSRPAAYAADNGCKARLYGSFMVGTEFIRELPSNRHARARAALNAAGLSQFILFAAPGITIRPAIFLHFLMAANITLYFTGLISPYIIEIG